MRRLLSPRRSAQRARKPARAKAPTAARVVRLRMPSRRASVAPTVDRILDAVHDAGLDDGQRDDFAVALAEALSNAAVHGNQLHHATRVKIAVEVTPGEGAVVEIADSGSGFDQGALADPTHPARLLRPGGRGVFLMRRLVDQIEYNGAGNQVRLIMKARNGGPPADK